MKIEITKDGVTDHSSILDVGAVIELDDVNAASLVKAEYAIAAEDTREDPGELTTEQMAKNLDYAYKADALKEGAVVAGVKFDDKATKGAVIAAVIEAGKYAALMQ